MAVSPSPSGDLPAAIRFYTFVMDDRPVLAVGHRAGNNVADLRAAVDAGVHLVEADVHLYRGALEVRHRKAIGSPLHSPAKAGRLCKTIAVLQNHRVTQAARG